VLILTINCGSSSLKVDLLDYAENRPDIRVGSISVFGIGSEPKARARFGESAAEAMPILAGGYGEATVAALVQFRQRRLLSHLSAAGHRVVHGGSALTGPTLLDEPVLSAIAEASELAPLHNQPAIEAIHACREVLGPALPMVATFDTAFFRGLPAIASTYAIPRDLASKFGIRRYGFHGLAHRYMSQRFQEISGRRDARLVTLQLGAGCSAAAIRGGAPVDTSMGFTPLEGLVMATRSGDIDPTIPGYVAARTGMTMAEVEEMLNERSGLLGLSGATRDAQRLLEAEAAGDEGARLALDVFCYRIRKYIGAYAAALGGLDGIVFGGGIGENSADLRERIASGFQWLGLDLDGGRNRNVTGDSGRISSDSSALDCYVVRVDEAPIIARDTAACLSASKEAADDTEC
jgi:acetate kinase